MDRAYLRQGPATPILLAYKSNDNKSFNKLMDQDTS